MQCLPLPLENAVIIIVTVITAVKMWHAFLWHQVFSYFLPLAKHFLIFSQSYSRSPLYITKLQSSQS